jgi:hypothetical protein
MDESAVLVCRTRSTPARTSWDELEINCSISLAALAERWASSRTSCATTANPLPASPARAASTPALRASKLVWKAISSMTAMMLAICCDELAMRCMAASASLTISPDCLALALAS